MSSSGAVAQIRGGRATDVARLCEIELAGSTLFAAYGMVNDELRGPMTPDDVAGLERRIAAGRLWVALVEEAVAAYIAVGEVDDNAHLLQVTVDPAFGRRRIGERLIEYAAGVARADGFRQMTLTTYRDVPWNGPYYEALGFRAIPVDTLTSAMRAIRDHEGDLGLDEWPRIAMVRDL
jgi:GNAT superfamily N-acetyltransferase